jgi:small redox-active disulfide protein 2
MFFQIKTIRTQQRSKATIHTMKIQILGTGCARCNALTLATEQAAQALGLQYEFEKVTDLQRIMSFGVMRTPALVVDGRVKLAGKVPSVAELKELLLPEMRRVKPGM